jgi:hypothetical protein
MCCKRSAYHLPVRASAASFHRMTTLQHDQRDVSAQITEGQSIRSILFFIFPQMSRDSNPPWVVPDRGWCRFPTQLQLLRKCDKKSLWVCLQVILQQLSIKRRKVVGLELGACRTQDSQSLAEHYPVATQQLWDIMGEHFCMSKNSVISPWR